MGLESSKPTSGAFGGWKGIVRSYRIGAAGTSTQRRLSGLSAALPAREESGIQKSQTRKVTKTVFCLLQPPFAATAPLTGQWV